MTLSLMVLQVSFASCKSVLYSAFYPTQMQQCDISMQSKHVIRQCCCAKLGCMHANSMLMFPQMSRTTTVQCIDWPMKDSMLPKAQVMIMHDGQSILFSSLLLLPALHCKCVLVGNQADSGSDGQQSRSIS